MKRLVLLSVLALCACKQQDAALSVTITGQFRIPADADKLSMDVLDSSTVILHKDWCVTGCADALPPQPGGLNQTVTLVESGASHPHVKINLTLYQGQFVQGQGTNTADFQDGATVPVTITISR